VGLLLFASSAGAEALPGWAGPVDVFLALSLVVTAALLYRAADGQAWEWSLRAAYPVAVWLPSLLLLAMWLGRDSLDFNVLLPGVVWRLFLVLHTLPYALELWRR
jgi:hypothetical protein